LVSQVGFRKLFGNRSRNEIDPEQEDAIVFRDNNRRVRFLNITMQGRPDDFRVSLGRMRSFLKPLRFKNTPKIFQHINMRKKI
jgi:hypothetical protein